MSDISHLDSILPSNEITLCVHSPYFKYVSPWSMLLESWVFSKPDEHIWIFAGAAGPSIDMGIRLPANGIQSIHLLRMQLQPARQHAAHSRVPAAYVNYAQLPNWRLQRPIHLSMVPFPISIPMGSSYFSLANSGGDDGSIRHRFGRLG